MHFLCPQDSEKIIFWPLFGNSLWKQAILFYHQKNPDEPVVLDLPQSLIPRMQKTVGSDQDLSRLDIRYGKEEGEGSPFFLNRIFYGEKDFVDIHSRADLLKLRSLMKEKIRQMTPTFVARVINKRISLPLSHFLAVMNISPNTITLVAFLFSLMGALFLLNPQNWLWGFLFFQINSLLDGCDGEVARLNLRATRLGKKLDVYADYLTSLLLMGGAAFGILNLPVENVFKFLAYPILLLPVLTGCFWLTVWSLGLLPGDLDDVEGKCHRKLESPLTIGQKIMSAFLGISRRDFYIFCIFILALFKQNHLIPIALVLVCGSWVLLSVYSLKTART